MTPLLSCLSPGEQSADVPPSISHFGNRGLWSEFEKYGINSTWKLSLYPHHVRYCPSLHCLATAIIMDLSMAAR